MSSINTNFVSSQVVFGTVYRDEKVLTEQDFNTFLRQPDFITQLRRLSGFYAVYSECSGKVIFLVDRVRSIPLFYAETSAGLFISDQYDWIAAQLPEHPHCEKAKAEFLLSGFVSGSRTLHPTIKQVEAGQVITYCKKNKSIYVNDYFLFDHIEPEQFIQKQLEEAFYSVVDKVFQRLITHANGRQIVLPLSGGFDSRLIAASLKRLNYSNVVCFSYGVENNKEASLSKKIAASLGFEWHFIEYSDAKWRDLWFSEQSQAFQRMASQGVSLPHIQDFLAVSELKVQGIVEQNAIFVPGHSGDFVAGSHIPNVVFGQNPISHELLLEALITDHYTNTPYKNTTELNTKSDLKALVGANLPVEYTNTKYSFANSYECWDWRERQAKYIINSVRVYDFHGFSWWLPLWDQEFVSFWCHVPLELRKKRLWYNDLVAYLFQQYCSSANELSKKNAASLGLTRRLAHIAYAFMPDTIKAIVYKKKIRRDFDEHFLNFGALLTERQKNELARYGYNMIGVYSLLYLDKRWGKVEELQ
jgi:asparagine synthase (glutamine-hydrolysing)